MNLLTEVDGSAPLIRALVRGIAMAGSKSNKYIRKLKVQRASQLLKENTERQDTYADLVMPM